MADANRESWSTTVNTWTWYSWPSPELAEALSWGEHEQGSVFRPMGGQYCPVVKHLES